MTQRHKVTKLHGGEYKDAKLGQLIDEECLIPSNV